MKSSAFIFDVALSTAIAANGKTEATSAGPKGPLSPEMLDKMNRYWRAANYLCIGQIYLFENPLLREPLKAEQIKPRLLGHWGTSPGQNLIYIHLNRLIKEHDADIIYIAGPGHGGPSLNACSYLEGTYTEVHPEITADEDGLRLMFRKFSTPGGVPSHCGPHVPNSMHEGGELGYSLVHAFGAAFDNPDLIVACVIGDGESETCPLEGSWKSVNFLNPVRDGAVLPILHLNGYKISGPTAQGRTSDEDLKASVHGPRLQALLCRGGRSRGRASTSCSGAGRLLRRDSIHSAGSPQERIQEAARLAHDHSAHAQGMDLPEGSGWNPDRRHLPRTPGSTCNGSRESRASQNS